MTYYYSAGSNYTVSSANAPVESVLNVAGSAGWTIVDTVAAGSYKWTMIVSPSSLNGVTDYCVGVGRTDSAFYSFVLCESWNTNSKTAHAYAPFSINPDIGNFKAESADAYLPGSSNWMWQISTTPRSGTSWHCWAKERTLAVAMQNSGVNVNITSLYYRTKIFSIFDIALPSSVEPCPIFMWTNVSCAIGVNTGTWGAFAETEGRFTRTAGRNSLAGFNALLRNINYFSFFPSQYTNKFLYSKSVVVNVDGWGGFADHNSYYGARGVVPDIYFGHNSMDLNKRTSWTFSNSTYYARNLSLNVASSFTNSSGTNLSSSAGKRLAFALLFLE